MHRQLLTGLLPILLVGCSGTTLPTSNAPSNGPSNNDSTIASPPATPATGNSGSQAPSSQASPSPQATSTPLASSDSVSYRSEILGSSLAHIVTIPANGNYVVKPVVAEQLKTIDQFAQSSQAIAAINGGFYDPKNQKTTSYVVTNKKTVADPKQNEQLTKNPNLKIYLRQIFDRSEFRRYNCAGNVKYGIQRHSKPAPDGCEVIDAIGGGPQLLPDLKSQREAFIDPEMGRDAIGTKNPNARSAIGITKDNQVVLVMVEQTKPDVGMTIAELAGYMKSIGAETAMNLDGGSSSSIFHDNKTIYGSVVTREKKGKAVKSAIVVTTK
ncbi:phosphodiester glycosidase family protein [filamentous cyanobacterium LEGE 11480]|uniref:Phosphodiester glycosidase family protein n=1 Tax=Romeriopsis navalis LEGE 11480 TaxID=2777977 RepID=A0A928VU22_9CYAN|nr:phosphodiester glycosidase family protein [Romeriopsis navalis]MBE9032234.1 phosphodiester glycosidase family protein [Romeriopsis navalis LEGE 11480]